MNAINTKEHQEFEDYKIKSFFESYAIWQKISTQIDLSITRKEILSIINHNNDLIDSAKNKAIERANYRFKLMFKIDNDKYYYDRKGKKYKLDSLFFSNNKQPNHKLLYDFLITSSFSQKLNINHSKLSNAFQFEYQDYQKNIPVIFKLIDAINNKKVIRFKHFNYFNGEICSHLIEPWFIKPFKGKFYLGCYRLEKNGIENTGYRHFTVSQIDSDSIEILDLNIDSKRKEGSYPNLEIDLFEKCIGVRIFREDNPNEQCFRGNIVIEANYTTGKEWLNNPKHLNQKCIKEAKYVNDTFQFIFEDFYFNSSMKQLILENGNNIKLLAPLEAVNELKIELKNVLTKY
jgi:hypothetical protein